MKTIPEIEKQLWELSKDREALRMEAADLRCDLANLREQLQVERNDNRIAGCKVETFPDGPVWGIPAFSPQ